MPRSRGRPKTRERRPGRGAASSASQINAAANTRRNGETQDRSIPGESWPDAICGFHEHCGGLFSAEIIRPPITSAAKLEIAVAILNWFGQAAEQGAAGAPLCLDCDTAFRPGAWPAAFLVLMPAEGPAVTALLIGVCDHCAARSDDELKQAALRRLSSIWPNLRHLPAEHFHATGGRA